MKKILFVCILFLLFSLCGCFEIHGWSGNDKPIYEYFLNFGHGTGTETTEPVDTAPLKTWESDAFLGSYEDPVTKKIIEYHMYIPNNATENMPLIVYLHGIGAVGASEHNENNPMIEKAVEIYGNEFPFMILAPCSMNNSSWSAKQLPERVKALVDYIAETYHSDMDRIILVGHSMGADGVFVQIEHYGDFYSAAIPISMPKTEDIHIEKCLNVPIWGFAGSLESPYNHQMKEFLDEITAMGGKAVYTELEGIAHGKTAHHAILWDVLQWAMEQ